MLIHRMKMVQPDAVPALKVHRESQLKDVPLLLMDRVMLVLELKQLMPKSSCIIVVLLCALFSLYRIL